MSSEWVPDMNPTELPDGTWVCGAHHQSICHICCCDYAYLQEMGDESETDNDDAAEMDYLEDYDSDYHFRHPFERRNPQDLDDNSSRIMRASHAIPPISIFTPPEPTDTPEILFKMGERIVRRRNPHEILIYTDGASHGNGTTNAKAGCGFVCGSDVRCAFRLENVGPTGEHHQQTSNRAELRAVIGALECRAWAGDTWGGWDRIVIATDSTYVVSGITDWIHSWIARGWVTSEGQPVKNRDLWERLLELIEELDQNKLLDRTCGVAVSFWKIPRIWNEMADREANRAANLEEVHRHGKIIFLPYA